jgi:hypothetical protein
MIGISSEDEATIRAHLTDHPIPYRLARDPDSATQAAYLGQVLPHLVLIDALGVVRFVGLGVQGARALESEFAKLPPHP